MPRDQFTQFADVKKNSSNQPARFEFCVFVDGVERQVFGACQHRLDAELAEPLHHFLFFDDRLPGCGALINLLGRRGDAVGEFGDFDVFKKNDDQKVEPRQPPQNRQNPV